MVGCNAGSRRAVVDRWPTSSHQAPPLDASVRVCVVRFQTYGVDEQSGMAGVCSLVQPVVNHVPTHLIPRQFQVLPGQARHA